MLEVTDSCAVRYESESEGVIDLSRCLEAIDSGDSAVVLLLE